MQISEQHFKNLLEARNAMGSALQRLADVAEALARKGDDSVPVHLRGVTEGDLAAAVSDARGLVAKYGEHAAFVIR